MTLQMSRTTQPSAAHFQSVKARAEAPGRARTPDCADSPLGCELQALHKSAQICGRGVRSWQTAATALAEMTVHDLCFAVPALLEPERALVPALRVVRDCVGGGCLLCGMAVEITADASYPLYRRLDRSLERLVGTH